MECIGNLVLDSNEAEIFGSGLDAYLSSLFLEDSAFNNTAVQGGGMDIKRSDAYHSTVIFKDGAAGILGGGLDVYRSSLFFKDGASFTSYTAVQGGGVNIESSDVNMLGVYFLTTIKPLEVDFCWWRDSLFNC